MSKRTKKSFLKGLDAGTPVYVIAHAKWRASRGKNPSMYYDGAFGAKALKLARIDINPLLKTARKQLARMLETGYSDECAIPFLRVCLHDDAKASPEDIGITVKEIDALQHKILLTKARKELAEILHGYSNEYSIPALLERLEKSKIVPEDIGTTMEELDKLQRKILLTKARKELAKMREQGCSPTESMSVLMIYLKNAKATPEDIGTSMEELDALQEQILLNARQVA